MLSQEVAIGIDGVKTEFLRQGAAFRKRQYVAHGAAVGLLRVGRCIGYIQCSEPSAFFIFQISRAGFIHFEPFNQRLNLLNSELLMCRKIGCNRNVRKRVIITEFGRIVLNLIFYF